MNTINLTDRQTATLLLALNIAEFDNKLFDRDKAEVIEVVKKAINL